METKEKLINEIRQIKVQYEAEVTGPGKQWPLAIQNRVMQLSDDGTSVKKIADQTGILYHTIALWKSNHSKKHKFHQLPVVRNTNPKANKKIVTVTDTKNMKTIAPAEKSVTVCSSFLIESNKNNKVVLRIHIFILLTYFCFRICYTMFYF